MSRSILPRTLLALAALLLSATSLAASLADRSPFVQGHWWNRDRSGNGFDVFNTADQVAVVWYTYDEASKPIWYIAQGTLASLGKQSWPLTQQSWANGRPGAAATVGSVKVEIVDPETLRVTWDIRGHTGQWNIAPLIASGIASEIDHSGHWFDPAQSGWGFNLTEQGDALGTVVYAYDTAGAPTWVAGFGRDAAKRSVDVFSTMGACPWCTYRPTVSTKVGTVTFEYRAEAEIFVRSAMTVAMASGVNVDGAHAKQLGRPASMRPADRQLATFDSDASLKAYLEAGMLNVPVVSAGDFSPAPPSAAVPFSPTNLQEQGVDEADLVKTDGRVAYAYRHDSANMREPVIRVAAIGADGSSLAALGSAALASGASTPVVQAGLYLAGNQLISIASTQPVSPASSAWALTTAWTKGVTNVEVLDVSSPATPATRWRAEIEGNLVASRRIGNKVYVVTRFVPFIQGFTFGTANGTLTATANTTLLAATPLENMLPKVRINGGAPSPLVTATALFAPPQGSTPPVADMVVVTTVDLASLSIAQTIGVVGPVEAIYASTANLYLATRRSQLRTSTGAIVSNASPSLVTDIHQFAFGSSAMTFTGSASVEGFLSSDLDKAPFRLSEANGRLRVVTSTTSDMGWGLRSQANTLTILEPSTVAPGLLKTVSILPNASRPQPLGLPFEELYATRFVGDRLYAVTFVVQQAPRADPLYAVDLSNAADPKILGDLVIPGFSDYLHPLANGKLLGFGRVVTTTGIQQGLQLSLFDVGGDGAPRVIQQLAIGKRGSDSALLRDHHAISVLSRSDGNANIAFPARIHDGTIAFGTGDSAMYSWTQSGLLRYEVRTDGTLAALNPFPPLLTEQMPQSAPVNDAAANNARAIQLPLGTVYVANGRFWLQSSTGGVAGPF